MKRAGAESLSALEPLLAKLRSLPGLTEKKPGIFYDQSVAYLHFHEDPAGLFADVKLGSAAFERFPVSTRSEQESLFSLITQSRKV